MPKSFRHALRLLALVAAILGTQGSAPAASCPGMTDLISHGAYGVADTSGRITAGCNLDESLMPASIIKVATVLAAMRILGPDYHFATEFYQDQLGNLYIRGLGDPTLVSEEVARIATRLRSLGLTRVATLFVDDSAFALEGPMPGQTASANPYDAPVAALAVNFNTLAIVKNQAGIASGEAQTPELPLMQELARNQASGRMRLNVCMGGADTEQCSIRYAEELFRALLEQAGIRVEGLGGRGVVPQDARLLLRYESSGNLELIAQDLHAFLLQLYRQPPVFAGRREAIRFSRHLGQGPEDDAGGTAGTAGPEGCRSPGGSFGHFPAGSGQLPQHADHPAAFPALPRRVAAAARGGQ